MKAVASSTYRLWAAINLQKLETGLSRLSTPSSMVRNEKQEIEIGTAVKIPASIVCFRKF